MSEARENRWEMAAFELIESQLISDAGGEIQELRRAGVASHVVDSLYPFDPLAYRQALFAPLASDDDMGWALQTLDKTDCYTLAKYVLPSGVEAPYLQRNIGPDYIEAIRTMRARAAAFSDRYTLSNLRPAASILMIPRLLLDLVEFQGHPLALVEDLLESATPVLQEFALGFEQRVESQVKVHA